MGEEQDLVGKVRFGTGIGMSVAFYPALYVGSRVFPSRYGRAYLDYLK